MAQLINQPPNSSVDQGGAVSPGWANFFSAVFNILSALVLSGTTANRPTKFLWTGRPYFDTTLVLPIWYSGAAWIKADGTPA